MARANYVKKAQKDIYQNGKRMDDGKIDRSLPANDQDTLIVEKGKPYYWWKFRYGGKHFSMTPPKAQQLTQNDFQIFLLDTQEQINNLQADCTISDEVQCIIDEIESKKEELEERPSNMPEHLQESSSSGELLTERIQALEEWHDELDSVDKEECDEEEKEGEAKNEILNTHGIDDADFDDMPDDDFNHTYGITRSEIKQEIEDKKNELIENYYQNILDEIQAISPNV